jgi:cell division protein FtsB
MREFKRRRGQQEELIRFVVKCGGVVCLFVVTLFLMRAAWGMYTKMAAASQDQEQAEAQLAALEAQQQGVNNTLGVLSSSRGVETQIRERFGVAKPGEGEIDIVRDQKTVATTTPAKESWFQHMFRALFVW